MDYRWIQVPQTRDLVDPTDKTKVLIPGYSFFKWLIYVLLPDQKFSKNWKTVRTAGEIEQAFESAAPLSWVKIHVTAGDLLKNVCEEPSTPFANAHLLPQAMDYFLAITEKMVDKDPAAPAAPAP